MTANDIIGDARVARVRELKTALSETKARLAKVEAERDALLAHFELALVALRDFEQLDGGWRRENEARNRNAGGRKGTENQNRRGGVKERDEERNEDGEGTKCEAQSGTGGRLHIIDGWNAILRCRNVSKLTSEDISKLKADYLAGLGINRPPSVAETCGLHSLPLTPPADVAGMPGARHTPPADVAGRLDARLTSPADGARSGPQPLNISTSQPLTCWIVFDGPDENSYRSGQYRVTYTGGTGLHRADRLILDYVHSVKLLGLDTSRITVETADKALAKRLTAFGAKVVVSE